MELGIRREWLHDLEHDCHRMDANLPVVIWGPSEEEKAKTTPWTDAWTDA